MYKIFITALALSISLSGCKCQKYASDYSCNYVENKATYEVWYWKNVQENNPNDEELIGTATGLNECKTKAEYHSYDIKDEFRERSYICILMENGVRMEKHRPL